MSVRLAKRLKDLNAKLGMENADIQSDISAVVDEVKDAILDAAVEKAKAEVTGGATPAADAAPAAETPAEDTPAEETPAEDAPTDEVPAEDTPAEGEAEATEEDDDDSTEVELDSGAQEILEINAEGEKVSEEEETVDAVSETMSGLESIALGMESNLANGGLTPAAAFGYQLALESEFKRIGMTNTSPSMEAFGGTGTRVHATNISIESVRDKVKELGRAMMQMLLNLKEFLSKFYQKVFTATGRLKSSAETILKSAASLGAKSSETVSGNGSQKLTIDGKLPADLGAAIGELGALLDASYQYSDKAVGYADALGQGIAGVDMGNDEKFSASVKALVEKAKSTAPDFEPAKRDYRGTEAAAAGMGGKQTDVHLGGVSVIAIRLVNDVDTDAALRGVAAQRNIVDIQNGEALEKLTTLDSAAMTKIANEVLKIVAAIDGFKDTEKKISAAIDALSKAGKGFDRGAAKAEQLSAENKKSVMPLLNAVKSVSNVVMQPSQKLTQHSINVCQAAIKYCNDSLKAYGKAVADSAEPAKA